MVRPGTRAAASLPPRPNGELLRCAARSCREPNCERGHGTLSTAFYPVLREIPYSTHSSVIESRIAKMIGDELGSLVHG